MKKIAILFAILISMAGLTACKYTDAVTEGKTIIGLELDKNYDDSDPFINAKLFCVSEDTDVLNAEGTFEMDGESVILEMKNNKTNEVLWSHTWEGEVKSEVISITLQDLKEEDEYAIWVTGTKINYAMVDIEFDSDLVQERTKPSR